LTIARVVQTGLTFFVFWLCSIRLSRESYGTYQKTFVVAALCSSLLAAGMPLLISSLPLRRLDTLLRMIREKTKWYYGVNFLAIAVCILVFLSFIPWSTRCLLLIFSCMSAAWSIAEIYYIKLSQDKWIFLVNILYAVLFTLIHLLFLLQFPFHIDILLTALILLSALRLCFSCFKKGHSSSPLKNESTPEDTSDTYTRQWMFLTLNDYLDAFSRNIDNIFLLWLLSSAAFAAYFNGSYEVPVTGILISAAGTLFSVQVNQYDHDHEALLALFHKICILLSCLLFPLFFFLQMNAATIYEWIFQGKYNDSVNIFLISIWILPLRIANYTVLLQNKLESQLIFRGSLVGLAAKMLFCLILYPIWGVLGVAAAIIAGTAVQMGYYLYHSARVLDVKLSRIMPFGKLLAAFILCGVLSRTGQWLVNTFAPVRGIYCNVVIMLLLIGAALFLYYPATQEKYGK
jgi:putative polysaccharide biosynthesis protein